MCKRGGFSELLRIKNKKQFLYFEFCPVKTALKGQTMIVRTEIFSFADSPKYRKENRMSINEEKNYEQQRQRQQQQQQQQQKQKQQQTPRGNEYQF